MLTGANLKINDGNSFEHNLSYYAIILSVKIMNNHQKNDHFVNF